MSSYSKQIRSDNKSESSSNTPSYTTYNSKGEIPATLKNLDSYFEKNKNKLDIKVNAKKRSVVENFLKKLVENHEFCMDCSTDAEMVKDIMDTHFKNSFEKGHKSLATREKLRTQELFGVSSEDTENWADENAYTIDKMQFAKYGYLGSDKYFNRMGDKTNNLKFIFKKDAIKDRTTMLIGSIYENNSRGKAIASRVTDPKIECIPGIASYNSNDENRNDYGIQVETAICDLINRGSIKPEDDPSEIVKKINKRKMEIGGESDKSVYGIELHYHGKLTKDDVEICFVPAAKAAELVPILNKAGIKTWPNLKSAKLINMIRKHCNTNEEYNTWFKEYSDSFEELRPSINKNMLKPISGAYDDDDDSSESDMSDTLLKPIKRKVIEL